MARKIKREAVELFDEVVTAPTENELKTLESQIGKAIELMKTIVEGEEHIKALNMELNKITSHTIPDQMAAARVDEFKTKEGVTVKIKDYINGSLPKDPVKRKAALQWFFDIGAETLIRSHVAIDVPPGNSKERKKLTSLLTKNKVAFDEETTIHPQTLQAFARERLENGEKVPLDLLGLHVGRHAKITLPRQKKEKPTVVERVSKRSSPLGRKGKVAA